MTNKLKAKLIEVITDYFVKLEKKQSSEQIKEVDKKGLWNADLISATFEELSNGLSAEILSRLAVDEQELYRIVVKWIQQWWEDSADILCPKLDIETRTTLVNALVFSISDWLIIKEKEK